MDDDDSYGMGCLFIGGLFFWPLWILLIGIWISKAITSSKS